ncbi:hypothetical protein, partial [Pseudomonas aeruginosa]|uniref:hypothetical protein n=1 Tax=Pseudomonas aeruginosa TaxID=287 RepID=UPI0022479F1B
LASGIWHLASGIWHLASGIWHLASGIWNSTPSPGNQKRRKRALNDFRFAPKPSKAVSSHPKAAEAALRLSLRNG